MKCQQCEAYAAGINAIVQIATDEKNHREETRNQDAIEYRIHNIKNALYLLLGELDNVIQPEKGWRYGHFLLMRPESLDAAMMLAVQAQNECKVLLNEEE
jgi:hypothetical protein